MHNVDCFMLTTCQDPDDLDNLSRCSHEAPGGAETGRFSREGLS